MGRLLGCIGCFSRAQIISSPNAGEEWEGSGLHRLHFQGHRSYPHPMRERNGKAPWLHRLLFLGHRSYPHPIRERNEKAPWLRRLLFHGHRSYPQPIRERNRKAPRLHLEGHRSYPHPIRERNGKAAGLHRLLFKGTDHILTECGRGMGRLLGCSGCFFQAIISSTN